MGSSWKEGSLAGTDDYGVGEGTHYEALGVKSDSKYAEIRAKYREAILALHPDKVSSCSSLANECTSIPGLYATRESSLLKDEEFVPALQKKGRDPTSQTVNGRKSPPLSDHLFSRIKELGSEGSIDHSGEKKFTAPIVRPADKYLSQFLRVQEAWQVLRDADSRAAYDALLDTRVLSSRLSVGAEDCRVIGEEIVLEDMEGSGVGEGGSFEFWYSCRCSDYFVVSQRELEEAGLEIGGRDEENEAWNDEGEIGNKGCSETLVRHGVQNAADARGEKEVRYQGKRRGVGDDKADGETEYPDPGAGHGDSDQEQRVTDTREEDRKREVRYRRGVTGADGRRHDETAWNRQRRSMVLPCQSCSLHLRVHYWALCLP